MADTCVVILFADVFTFTECSFDCHILSVSYTKEPVGLLEYANVAMGPYFLFDWIKPSSVKTLIGGVGIGTFTKLK